jgi:hypothetical protein
MLRRSVIFVVISFLVVMLVYTPSSTFAVPNRSNDQRCSPTGQQTPNGGQEVRCCWFESVPPGTGYDGSDQEIYCSECEDGGTRGKINCNDPYLSFRDVPKGTVPLQGGGVLEDPPTPSPSGPAPPLQGGGVLEQPPTEGVAPPLTRGQGVLPKEGVLEQPPAEDETTQPLTEPLPPCPEGQILDEESGLCVLEEPEVTEEPEQQPSEGADSSEDNSNN